MPSVQRMITTVVKFGAAGVQVFLHNNHAFAYILNKQVFLYQVLYFCGCEMNAEKEPNMHEKLPQRGDEYTVSNWNFSLHVVSG